VEIDGWKLPVSPTTGTIEKEDEDGVAMAHSARKETVLPLRAPPDGRTPPAPRLLDDLKALAKLTDFPPRR
jgi:hypothetical protein